MCVWDGPPNTPEEAWDLLTHMSGYSIALGLVLTIGSALAQVPQWISIIRAKSSEGLSILTLFLGTLNQTSTLINIFIFRYPQLSTCPVVGFLICSPSLLALYQVAGTFLSFFPVMVLAVVYYPPTATVRDRRLAQVLLGLCVLYLASVFTAAIIMLQEWGPCASAVLLLAYGMGLVSTVVNFIQWAPQIWRTFRLGSRGALSIVTLCITAPGSVITVGFLIFISRENLSTWGPYATSAVQQLILLGLCIFFELRQRLSARKAAAADALAEDTTGEKVLLVSPRVDRDGDAPSGDAVAAGTRGVQVAAVPAETLAADDVDALPDAVAERVPLLPGSVARP